MTRDPQRLLSDESDADELERALLASLRGEGPSDAQKAAMRGALAAQIGALGSGLAASSAAAHASGAPVAAQSGAQLALAGGAASKALALKVVVLVAALGGGAALGGRLWSEAPRAPVRAPQRVLAPAPPVLEPAREPPPPVVHPTVRKRPEARPEARSERLALESRRVAAVRAALRAGDTARARAELDRLRTQRPGGVLTQERELLTIEVLAAEGRGREAALRARAFIAAHPDSPHNARLEQLAGAP